MRPPLDSSGNILHFFPGPSTRSNSITWDGTYLWIDGLDCNIYQVDTSGNIFSSFVGPPCSDFGYQGLTWDGNYLWIIDYYWELPNGAQLHQLDTEENIISSFYLSLPTPIGHTDLAWDGKYLWFSGYYGNYYRIDRLGNIIDSFELDYDAHGLTWDGTYLWGVDARGSDTFFKMDVNDSYPTSPFMDVGNNGIIEWNYTGEFSLIETTPDISEELNGHLRTHNDLDDGTINGKIEVPLRFHSDTAGRIKVNNLCIQYTDSTPSIGSISIEAVPQLSNNDR